MFRIALLLTLLALPAGAQELANEPAFLAEEGPSLLNRHDVRVLEGSTIRWENRAEHPPFPHHGRPEAHTHVVLARWDPKACVRKRGPFCTRKGGWAKVAVLNARESEVEQIETGDEGDRFLIFARSRLDPSPPDAWQIDRLIIDEPAEEPAGARRLIFDASATVIGSKVRYSVLVMPGATD